MVLGGIAVFLIDRRFYRAAGFCLFGAALSIVGLIHGDKVHVFTDGKIALGYALAGGDLSRASRCCGSRSGRRTRLIRTISGCSPSLAHGAGVAERRPVPVIDAPAEEPALA